MFDVVNSVGEFLVHILNRSCLTKSRFLQLIINVHVTDIIILKSTVFDGRRSTGKLMPSPERRILQK